MASAPLKVEVVSADRLLWSGEADQVIARTTEGDIGILPDHTPLLAVLVPAGIEVFGVDGNREVIAVDGGFISVDHNQVRILSEFAQMAGEISLSDAENDREAAVKLLDAGAEDEATRRRFLRADAQVKAARKHGSEHAGF
ncbi:F0F1 ATP synthase subunit epsilon [Granulicoccus phenolivorans]|uniref:F0F1 ATP synthase subunit epsilon n=1 Tax=Granulicoccus phenolivorans TaxID=266854 RepID=UPI000413FF43|nr:F0F1 ATP synthase subunit epsilon [Granulicoccus phenolivorans]